MTADRTINDAITDAVADMSMEEIFLKIAHHLLRQGKRAIIPDDGTVDAYKGCLYVTPDNLSCAAGCLLLPEDRLLHEQYERSLVDRDTSEKHRLIREMQHIHDWIANVQRWPYALLEKMDHDFPDMGATDVSRLTVAALTRAISFTTDGKTPKQIAELVRDHLLNQAQKARNPSSTVCVYRSTPSDPHGYKCAVGCLIPEESYHGSMDYDCGMMVVQRHIDAAHIPASLLNLLLILQNIHDKAPVSQWERELDFTVNSFDTDLILSD